LDSYQHLGELAELDARHAVTRPSNVDEHGVKMKAERRPARDAAPKMRTFVAERLATGAAVLAELWLDAWEQAGKPDLSGYQSYAYPTAPDFIAPDYQAAAAPAKKP
jgi:hypothetical protein